MLAPWVPWNLCAESILVEWGRGQLGGRKRRGRPEEKEGDLGGKKEGLQNAEVSPRSQLSEGARRPELQGPRAPPAVSEILGFGARLLPLRTSQGPFSIPLPYPSEKPILGNPERISVPSPPESEPLAHDTA